MFVLIGMTPEGVTALGERGGVPEPLHRHQVALSLDVQATDLHRAT